MYKLKNPNHEIVVHGINLTPRTGFYRIILPFFAKMETEEATTTATDPVATTKQDPDIEVLPSQNFLGKLDDLISKEFRTKAIELEKRAKVV
jgi:hypothetical protein